VAGLRLLGLVLFAPQSMQRLLVASAPGKGSCNGLEGGVQGAKGLHGLGNEIWLGCLISVKSLAPSRTGHKWKTH